MTSPQTLYALRWLIHDTFRQAMVGKVFWIMLAASALCMVFCLGLSIEGGDELRPEGDYLYHPKTKAPLAGPSRDLGKISLLFGLMRVDLARDRRSAVQLIQVILGTWVAGALGLLGTLVWTAGFLPEFLQPAQASVLLAKPVPRWLILVGKSLGVVLFVAFQAAVFFAGTWLVLGVRTNVWLYGYLLGAPLLVVHFLMIYSGSVLLAVWTRSSLACVLGSILFWMVSLAINYARYVAWVLPELAPEVPQLSPLVLWVVNAAYWIFPKPADLILLLEEALNAQAHLATLSALPEFAAGRDLGLYQPELAVLSSLLASAAILCAAGHQLGKKEY